MKTAVMVTSLKGFTVTIDGKTKSYKGGAMKQMVTIMDLNAAGYSVVDQNGKTWDMI